MNPYDAPNSRPTNHSRLRFGLAITFFTLIGIGATVALGYLAKGQTRMHRSGSNIRQLKFAIEAYEHSLNRSEANPSDETSHDRP